MPTIEFSREEREAVSRQVQRYMREELAQDIGQFDAEFLVDFFVQQVGPYIYNRGLYDAQAIMASRLESISEAIYEIEQPTPS